MTAPIDLLTDLQDINPTTYLQAEAYVLQLLQERFPDRDFTMGSGLYWLVGVAASAVAAAQFTNARLIADSLNLGAVRANPSQANDELVDLLLSNYYVERRAGTTSQGVVTYIVDRAVAYVIRAGQLLTIAGEEYEVIDTIFVFTTSDQITGTNDRALQSRPDGRWQFTVPVRSQTTGSATNVPLGTIAVPNNPPPGFVRAITSTSIEGGSNEQTTLDLIAQVPAKFAAATWGSRNNISSLIADLYPAANSWVLGMGSAELLRSKHNPLNTDTGGYSDVWVSTQDSVQIETRRLTAELVNVSARTWRLVLDRHQAAGVYQVQVLHADQPLPTVSVVRSISVPNDPGRPLIYDQLEAAYSAYQALTVDFTDVAQEQTGLVLGDTQEYDVQLILMPEIQQLTNTVESSGFINPANNALIRAVVPCLVSASITVRLLDSDFEDLIDKEGIRNAVVGAVNRIALGYGRLSNSIIAESVHQFIGGRSDIEAPTVTLRGDILSPTGEPMILGDKDELVIPDLPSKQVTKRTTKFFIDRSRIDLQFTRVDV